MKPKINENQSLYKKCLQAINEEDYKTYNEIIENNWKKMINSYIKTNPKLTYNKISRGKYGKMNLNPYLSKKEYDKEYYKIKKKLKTFNEEEEKNIDYSINSDNTNINTILDIDNTIYNDDLFN